VDYPELIQAWKCGNKLAGDEVIRRLEPMISKRAAGTYGKLDYEDKMQIGRIAVAQCMEDYDASRGKFTTLVHMAIRNSIWSAARSASRHNPREEVQLFDMEKEMDDTTLVSEFIDSLSGRELFVLEGVAKGVTQKQIGSQLRVTATTVKNIKKKIAEKWDAYLRD
jgi:RNA polymerase sigma factor (sigma-70 family)